MDANKYRTAYDKAQAVQHEVWTELCQHLEHAPDAQLLSDYTATLVYTLDKDRREEALRLLRGQLYSRQLRDTGRVESWFTDCGARMGQDIEGFVANARQQYVQAGLAEEQRAEAEAKAARERAARAERNRLAREKAAASGKKVPETKPETEPVREERVADTKGGYAMTKAEKRLSDDFASNKGRLPYPVSGRHTIVAAFGEQQHQELKYVRTNNSGIDIQTAPGTDARAVFNGEVTRVFVVPGYNNSVIVRHGNYLTVYSNLSQVYVKAGDKVSTRQAIGKIFTDTEDGNATILHFQLWKEKTKLNPAPWLD